MQIKICFPCWSWCYTNIVSKNSKIKQCKVKIFWFNLPNIFLSCIHKIEHEERSCAVFAITFPPELIKLAATAIEGLKCKICYKTTIFHTPKRRFRSSHSSRIVLTSSAIQRGTQHKKKTEKRSASVTIAASAPNSGNKYYHSNP